MRKTENRKIWIGLMCAAALVSAAGCAGKTDSDAKTAQQVQDFKGHQPTPEQLQAAIAKASQHAGPPPGQPAAPPKQ